MKVLEIPSKIESIKEIEKLVDEVSNELKLENSLYGNVLISLIEAVNNCILHGNKANEDKSIRVQVSNNDKMLTITVKDEGDGFDYEHIPDPTSPDNVQNVNGRGIFLMKQLSDNLIFTDKGSCVEIQFKLEKIES